MPCYLKSFSDANSANQILLSTKWLVAQIEFSENFVSLSHKLQVEKVQPLHDWQNALDLFFRCFVLKKFISYNGILIALISEIIFWCKHCKSSFAYMPITHCANRIFWKWFEVFPVFPTSDTLRRSNSFVFSLMLF